jgi:hypothetical protein
MSVTASRVKTCAPTAAGGADASGKISGRLLQRQRPQFAAQRDALLQLAEGRIVQQGGDLRLARQDHGQELPLVGFDVRE